MSRSERHTQRAIACEALERRELFTIQTYDFAASPVKLGQLDFLTPIVHTASTGFSYTLGNGAGQRENGNGITWPDAAYYESTLGPGGFEALNAWPMRAPIVYATANPSGWSALGWTWTQDMAEGATCLDDAGRAAMAYADAYLLNDDAAAFQRAKDVLTFAGYLTTRQGSTYNFAWLDAPTFFGRDAIQSQDTNYVYRVEYNKRTAYPSATPDASWGDPLASPSQIVGGSANPQKAPPFIAHQKYSIYTNDLRDASGNDVALVYNGPLYNASGSPAGFKTGIKENQTNSTQQFGFDEVRAMQGFAKGLAMMQKFASLNGGLVGDNLFFARFIENELNRLIGNFARWLSANPNGYDTKLGSAALSALVDYAQLTGAPNGLGFGRYASRLNANSNMFETTDDRPSATTVQSMIDTVAAKIQSKLLKTNDYRNGMFADDPSGANWEAWGELQIDALARTYQMKIAMGSSPSSVASLLDDASYAGDEFYGKAGWHYKDEAASNLANTDQRTVRIVNGVRYTEANADQIAYGQSSIMLGLESLADAWSVSGRAGSANRAADYREYMRRVGSWFIGNNAQRVVMYDSKPNGTGAKYSGIGAAFDGLSYGSPASSSRVNRNSGAESNIEALLAWEHLERVIAVDHLASRLVVDDGVHTAAASQAVIGVAPTRGAMRSPVPTSPFAIGPSIGDVWKRLFGAQIDDAIIA